MSGQGGPGSPNKISENIGGEIKVVANDLQTTAINNAVTDAAQSEKSPDVRRQQSSGECWSLSAGRQGALINNQIIK